MTNINNKHRKRKLTIRQKAFIQGMACCAAFVIEQGGHVTCDDVIRQMGISWKDLIHANVDEGDLLKIKNGLTERALKNIGFLSEVEK